MRLYTIRLSKPRLPFSGRFSFYCEHLGVQNNVCGGILNHCARTISNASCFLTSLPENLVENFRLTGEYVPSGQMKWKTL